MPGEATEVGSIIGYLVLNRSDWLAGVRATERDADKLGRLNPDIRIQTNAGAVTAQLALVNTETRKLGTSADSSKPAMGALLASILAIGPAAIPLAGVLAGAFAGAIPSVLTLALGVKGLTTAQQQGTLQTTALGQQLSVAQSNLQKLEQTAAGGVMKGFAAGLADINGQMPVVNRDVGALSTQIGDISGHVGPGLVALLLKLDPLFQTVGTDLQRGSQGFEHWAKSSDSVSKFVAYVQVNLPAVEATLSNLIQTGSHVVMAYAPFGSTMLLAIRLFSAAINDIPLPVLQLLVPLLTSAFIGFKTYAGVTSLLARVDAAILRHQAVVAQSTAAEVAADAEKTAAEAASAQTRMTLLAGVSAALEREAAAGVATAEKDAASAAARAASTAGAAAGATGAVTKLGSGLSKLPVIGIAVGAALTVATLVMGHHQKAAIADTEAVNRLTEALKNGTGALQIMQELRTSGAVSAATALGIDPDELAKAVTQQAGASQLIATQMDALRAKQQAAESTAQGAANAYGKLSQGLSLTGDEAAKYGTTLAGVKETQLDAQAEASKLAGRSRDLAGDLATVTRQFNEAKQKAADFAKDQGDAQLAAAVLTGTLQAQANALGVTTDELFASRSQLDKWVDSQKQSVIQSAFQASALKELGSQLLQQVAPGLNTSGIAAGKFDAALQTFSQSAGTAADRAKLVGAGLVAMQGDALDLAAAEANATAANDALTDAFKQQAQQLAQQNASQNAASRSADNANTRVTQAEQRLTAVRANRKSTAAQIKTAEDAVTVATNNAATATAKLGAAGAIAYSDTERAALSFTKVGNHIHAAINTAAAGAAPLIQQLQAMQDAAEKEAELTYQNVYAHDKNSDATKRAADAAAAAANVFHTQTYDALVKDATQLGLNSTQATALATAYFNMPKDFSTKAQLLGTKDVVDVLNKIGQLLANLTGQTWTSTLAMDTTQFDAAAAKAQAKLAAIAAEHFVMSGGTRSKGGFIQGATAGGGTVDGPGTSKSDSIIATLPNGNGWRLSKGEEVIQEPFASQWRPLLKAINNGKLTMPSQNLAGRHRGSDGDSTIQQLMSLLAARSAGVGIEHFEQHNHYPLPETPSDSTPKVLKAAAMALDVF